MVHHLRYVAVDLLSRCLSFSFFVFDTLYFCFFNQTGTTTAAGNVSGSFDVSYGYGLSDSNGHTVVAHANDGTKIACGVLSATSTLQETICPVSCDVCGVCGGSNTDASACPAFLLNYYYSLVQSCPYPMIPTSSSPDGVGTPEGYPCQLPCRTPHYDEESIDNMDTFFIAFTIISFIFITYTFLSVILTERKRKKRMVVLLVASSWLLCFPVLIQAMAGGDETLCKDDITPNVQSDGGTCTFVAVMIGYFGLAISFWWFCNIVHLFLRVGVLDSMCGASNNKKSSKSSSFTQSLVFILFYFLLIVSLTQLLQLVKVAEVMRIHSTGSTTLF